MRNYIEKLKRESERQLAESANRLRTDQVLVPWELLEVQIRRWWINLPPGMQQRRFQIAEIAAHCHGRYRDKPALREVAATLRALGWSEIRDWTNAGRNRRLWMPTRTHSLPTI